MLWTIKIAFLLMRAVTRKPTKQKNQKVPPLTMPWTRGPQLKFRSPIQTHTNTNMKLKSRTPHVHPRVALLIPPSPPPSPCQSPHFVGGASHTA